MKKGAKKKLNLGEIIQRMSEHPDNETIPSENSSLEKKTSKRVFSLGSLPPSDEENTNRGEIADIKQPPLYRKHKLEKDSIESAKKDTLKHPAIPENTPGNGVRPQPYKPEKISQTDYEEDEEEFDIFKYISIIMRRKEIVIFVMLITGSYSLFTYLKSSKFFMAKARLLYKPTTEIFNQTTSWRSYRDRDKNFNTHLELLKSNIVLERVVQKTGEDIKKGVIRGGLIINAGETKGEENNIIELSFRHGTAETARDIVNMVCQTYIEYRREVNAQEDTRLIVKLKTQIGKIQTELNFKENDLRIFKENNRMVKLSSDAHLVMTKLADMELSLQKTQLSLLESKERLTTLKSQINKQELNIVQSMTYNNPMISKLAEMELELNTLSGEYSQDHFKIKQLQVQIKNLKKAMQSEIKKEISDNAVSHTLVKNPIRESLLQTYVNQDIEISALESKRIAQEQILDKLNNEMLRLPSIEQKYAFLQRETESLLKTIKLLKMRLEETKIRRDSKGADLRILELAQTPKFSISTKKINSILIGLIIGLIMGIAIAFLLEYLDQSLKDPGDIENHLELPLIGMVPLIETENAIVNKKNLAKSILEPFRALRTNIKHIASQHNAKLFMICSAVKGEGKTTLATNLAITFGLDDKKVYLIDCDLRRSQIHTLLNIPKKIGVADYLAGTASFSEIVKPTIYKNLYVITSGERPHNPAELLGNFRFKQLLDELKRDADIVICDSPAIIPVSDTMSMAPFMDCSILVARALWTPIKAAKQAKNQLSRMQTNLVGGILNGISHSRGYYPYYYGYYGYYAYKYSYDYDDDPKKRFTIREFGLSLENNVKNYFKNIKHAIPRYSVFMVDAIKHLFKSPVFWILLILSIAVFSVKIFLFPEVHKNETITYLGELNNQQSEVVSPITVVQKEKKVKNTQFEEKIYPKNEPDDQILSPKYSSEVFFSVKESLTVWKKAFNEKNKDLFYRFYDSVDFKFPGGRIDQWKKKNSRKLLKNRSNYAIISIADIVTKKMKNNYYNSTHSSREIVDNDTLSYKCSMIWKRSRDHWRIIREKKSLVEKK